jgi:hypothetical protein
VSTGIHRSSLGGVVNEMRGFLAAVESFETVVSARTGIDRDLLRVAETMLTADALTADEIARVIGVETTTVLAAIEELCSAGKVARTGNRDDSFGLIAHARADLDALYKPLRDAQATLHTYRADELRTVRRFIRAGRELYADQARRLTSQ